MTPIQHARVSLEGLSVGDAFGEQFFVKPYHDIQTRTVPKPHWFYTDDTAMALCIFAQLERYGEIRQDELAMAFALEYYAEPMRGYGPAMHRLLAQIRLGVAWKTATTAMFDGMGSWGNGAAMRVAPLGAFFASDLERVKSQAILSAEVTHAHPEAIAGAVAVAIAAAQACRFRAQKYLPTRAEFIDSVLPFIPESETLNRARRARDLPDSHTADLVGQIVGNGSQISAQDTVPLCLWCAGEFLASYTEAMWETVAALGDRDTTCAIVGGIVACYTGLEGIPLEWRQAREVLQMNP